jgi:hypothetical protein
MKTQLSSTTNKTKTEKTMKRLNKTEIQEMDTTFFEDVRDRFLSDEATEVLFKTSRRFPDINVSISWTTTNDIYGYIQMSKSAIFCERDSGNMALVATYPPLSQHFTDINIDPFSFIVETSPYLCSILKLGEITKKYTNCAIVISHKSNEAVLVFGTDGGFIQFGEERQDLPVRPKYMPKAVYHIVVKQACAKIGAKYLKSKILAA